MRALSLVFALVASVVAQGGLNPPPPTPPKLPNPIPAFQVQTQYVTSKDGLKIFTQAVGPKSAPHVILAHGLACAHTAWDPLWNDPVLRASLYMVRYDTRGHGLTDKPLDPAAWNSSRFAQDVDAVVKAYGLKKPFFGGWSLAGAIAVDIANYWPSPLPFSGFISFAGLPAMDLIPSVTTDLVRSFVPGLIDAVNATNAIDTRVEFAGTLSSQLKNVDFDDMSAWVGAANYLPPLVAAQTLTRTHPSTRFFAEGKKGWPTLIMFGDKDDQVVPQAVFDVMKPFKNLEKHVFPGAGHIVFYDAKPQVASTMLVWVYANYLRSY